MIPDDTGVDAELRRTLVTLRREDPMSPAFTDRVLRDLAGRGFVRRPPGASRTTRWTAVAAAVVIFAAGLGVGAAIGGARQGPPSSPLPAASASPSRATADRAGAEVNVPRPGQSEVWF